MYFSQIIAAALALPALSYAAALPERRQTIDCAQYNTLSVGALTITNSNEREGDASLQVRTIGGAWTQIAVAKKGQSAQAVNIFFDGDGTHNLQVCSGSTCFYPAGGNPNKQWNMLRTGDRWNFALTTLDGADDGQVQALCHVGPKIVDGQTTTAAPAPTTTTTRAAPSTTSSTSTTTRASTTKSTSTSTRSRTSSSSSTSSTTTTRRHN